MIFIIAIYDENHKWGGRVINNVISMRLIKLNIK